MSEDRFQLLRLLEAILFASAEPLHETALAGRLPEGADLPGLLQELAGLYANRGVHLMQLGDRWAFRTAPDLAGRLQIETTVTRKMSRAAIETLAIIAYHQPVTRAEVEEVRGVALSRGTLDALLEAGWIRPKGRRQTPGRPVTWVTTDGFLDQFGLESCDVLPGIEELKAAGLLDSRSAISTLGAQAMAAVAPPEEDGDEDGEGEDAEPTGAAGTTAFEAMVAAAEARVLTEDDDSETEEGDAEAARNEVGEEDADDDDDDDDDDGDDDEDLPDEDEASDGDGPAGDEDGKGDPESDETEGEGGRVKR
jgi:segregation and condensation protein B